MDLNLTEMVERSAEAEDFLKRLANRNRLMVLCVLAEGEKSVGQLNEEVPLSQSALSQHLTVLRDAGLVHTRRDAQSVLYRLGDERVEAMLHTLHGMFCAP